MSSEHDLHEWRSVALRIEREVAQAVIGQAATIRLINVALFARGHVLLEGDVGVGKTTVLRAFARAAGGDFERVEGTVDLMPQHGDLDELHGGRRTAASLSLPALPSAVPSLVALGACTPQSVGLLPN